MATLTYKQLKEIVNSTRGLYWHEVAKYGKITSREAIIKCLLARGFQIEGLVLDTPKENKQPTEGTIAYIQQQIGVLLNIPIVTKGVVNDAIISQLDTCVVSNGIVAITLRGLSGKKYWTYALSVIQKILKK